MAKNKEEHDFIIKIKKADIKSKHLAIIIIVAVISYILVDFLKNVIELHLTENPTIVVLIITIVLIIMLIVVLYAIRKMSEK